MMIAWHCKTGALLMALLVDILSIWIKEVILNLYALFLAHLHNTECYNSNCSATCPLQNLPDLVCIFCSLPDQSWVWMSLKINNISNWRTEFGYLPAVETWGFWWEDQNSESIELSSMACCSVIKDISEHSQTSISPLSLLWILWNAFWLMLYTSRVAKLCGSKYSHWFILSKKILCIYTVLLNKNSSATKADIHRNLTSAHGTHPGSTNPHDNYLGVLTSS